MTATGRRDPRSTANRPHGQAGARGGGRAAPGRPQSRCSPGWRACRASGPAIVAAPGAPAGPAEPAQLRPAVPSADRPRSTRAPLPSLALATPGEMVTLLAEIESHRAPPQGARMPHRILARAGGEPLGARVLRRRTRPPGRAVRARRGRADPWPARPLRRPLADDPSASCCDPRRAADGLLPVYPLAPGPRRSSAAGDRRRSAGPAAGAAGMAAGRAGCAATAGRAGPRRCGPRTVRRRQRRSSPRRRPGSASPSTSCWPASWR